MMKFVIAAGLVALVGVVAINVFASSGGGYERAWFTIDGGGGTSTGGDYALSGTIGQPDAGETSGGDYAVSGGFWSRFVGWLYELFLPLIVR
jgi:hypothetical protein